MIEGIREGLGGGESGSSASSSTINRRSAQGDNDGSLVTLVMTVLLFLPRTIVLGDRESLLQELLGKEWVEKFDSSSTASPTDLVIRGN